MVRLDEFEVEPNIFYSGSYVDALFRGSIFDPGGRSVVARHSSGSNEQQYATHYSTYTEFSGSNRNRNLGVALKFQHFVSPNERYYDSLMPDIVEAYSLNSGKYVMATAEYAGTVILQTTASDDLPSGGAAAKLVFCTHDTTASAPDGNVADSYWFATFPFESRYRNLLRRTEVKFFRNRVFTPVSESRGFSTAMAEYGISAQPSASLQFAEIIIRNPTKYNTSATKPQTEPIRFNIVDVSGSVTTGSFYGITGKVYPTASNNTYGAAQGVVAPTITQLTKLFYGFGDNVQGVPVVTGVSSSRIAGTSGIINTYYASVADISGWKYGVINAFPYYSYCIFRAKKYGQFRDMLEQRKYSKFYDSVGFTVNGKNNGRRGVGESVITVRFVSGSESSITASNPTTMNTRDSGIYDFECKSGKPFVDL